MVVNMREYIQSQLDENNLGKLVKVKGPSLGRGGDASWWEITVVYRMNPDAHHFEDKYVDICLGYKNTGTYWNRRQIRLALAQEAKVQMTDKRIAAVWTSAQRELTAGPSGGAIEL